MSVGTVAVKQGCLQRRLWVWSVYLMSYNIVRKANDGAAAQAGVEQALAAHIKTVAINKTDHDRDGQ